jgi:hypothetical protein
MKRHEVYAKYEDSKGNFIFISMDELQDIGDPIDEDDVKMDLVDDEVYCCINGKYEVFNYVRIKEYR